MLIKGNESPVEIITHTYIYINEVLSDLCLQVEIDASETDLLDHIRQGERREYVGLRAWEAVDMLEREQHDDVIDGEPCRIVTENIRVAIQSELTTG